MLLNVSQLPSRFFARNKALPAGTALVVDAIDEALVAKYAHYARCELTGFAAFLGGVAAQEIVKRFGKFTPIWQWIAVDMLDLVGDHVRPDATPQNSRYDHQIAILGKAAQDKIFNAKWFVHSVIDLLPLVALLCLAPCVPPFVQVPHRGWRSWL